MGIHIRRLLDVNLQHSNFATLILPEDTAMFASMGDVYPNVARIRYIGISRGYLHIRLTWASCIAYPGRGQCEGLNVG